jgi:hypothetical protein
MPKFIIEREIPGAGKLSLSDLQSITEHSCGVLRSLGPEIQWVESYVTDDKVYCVYLAATEELIHAHAARSGFNADRITRVRAILDPTFSEVGLQPAAEAGPVATRPASHRPRRSVKAAGPAKRRKNGAR